MLILRRLLLPDLFRTILRIPASISEGRMSLQNRLGLLLLAFLLLMTVSVAATARVVTDQREDALVINLAGRQRMLIQQMTRDALQIELGRDPASARAELAESQAIFDQTLARSEERRAGKEGGV